MKNISVIDIFAGPGGLSEGFSSFSFNKHNPFKISLSIEKDIYAHKTLELRSFTRQFNGNLPDEYYDYLKGNIDKEFLYNKYKIEFEAASRESFCAELGKDNPKTIDKRIKQALKKNKNWVLIGGPPCQAYSLVGRARMKANKNFEKDHRHFLYKEYLRILAVHKPPVFIMENVKGLLSSKHKNNKIFHQILSDLKNPSVNKNKSLLHYNIFSLVKSINCPDFRDSDYVIKAEEYGVPQARHRVILVGIKRDIDISPEQLKKFGHKINLSEAINDLPVIRSTISNREKKVSSWKQAVRGILITKNGKIKNSFPAQLNNKIFSVVEKLDDNLPTGAEYFPEINIHLISAFVKREIYDKRIEGVINHTSRSHIISDLHRYLFSTCYAEIYSQSPKISDMPVRIWPAHKNVRAAAAGKMFGDRFRVQLKNRPSNTITSHIAKDGHYYIHPDPQQCRSLTVREAARLQTFPDNYFFEGPRTEQYKQVGNAVPPLLARQIAEIVYKIFQKMPND